VPRPPAAVRLRSGASRPDGPPGCLAWRGRVHAVRRARPAPARVLDHPPPLVPWM